MSRQHFPSLKEQLIKAMWDTPELGLSTERATEIFEVALWPVLDAAMTAGELLVSRATTPQKPVAVALRDWLRGCITVVANLKKVEPTVSKRELLNILYTMDKMAQLALRDVEEVQAANGNAVSVTPIGIA